MAFDESAEYTGRSMLRLLPLLFLTLACGSMRGRTLVVASDLDNAPFAAVDGSGRPVGRDVEMLERMAVWLGRPIEWRRMPFEELLPAVERSEVDVVCATIGITAERQRRMAFTRAYYETLIAAVIRAGPGEPRNLGDLAEKRVAAGAGTTSELAARRKLATSEIVTDAKGESSADRLRDGDVDALVMDGPAADALVRAEDGAFLRLAEALAVERYALAVPLGQERLLYDLNRALIELERHGIIEELDVRYGVRGSIRR